MITKQFTQEQLDAIYDSVAYLMECEQTHFEECLQDGDKDIINRHIYLTALDAYNALRTEAV
jgi:hypothetical protein